MNPSSPQTSYGIALDGDYVESNQLLKLAGICESGGAGKQLIASGEVAVVGRIELRKTH